MSSGEKLDGVNCKLANKEASKIRKLDTTYQQNLKMMDEIKPVLKQLFKMTDNQLKNMTFAKMTGYSDNILPIFLKEFLLITSSPNNKCTKFCKV